jgi:hypothetical protein
MQLGGVVRDLEQFVCFFCRRNAACTFEGFGDGGPIDHRAARSIIGQPG